jgi:phage terminase large subunit-like protein
MDLAEIGSLQELSDEEFRVKLAQLVAIAQKDRQENALRYYTPVSKTAARVWESDARVFAIGGGNGSGKTEQVLAFAIACATGVFPDSMKHVAAKRFRGPIRVRIVCGSITTVLYPTMLPKLQWWNWTGVDQPGGERGHWGWIPPYCLKDREWSRSWTEKLRMLTVLCRDPDDPNRVLGESVIQFMSYDQDPTDFASGDYHIVIHDEPPPLAIWTENEARTMRVAGRLLLSMTWPDDPSIPMDWIFDKVYEPGMAETQGARDVEWVNLYTTDNPNLNQEAVAKQSQAWSEEMRRVRLYGQPIRFSNRVHPLFTDQTQHWCFSCGKTTITQENPRANSILDALLCTACGGVNVTAFNHVREFDAADKWPSIWVIDPHPRKPHMGLWVMVDPCDDWWVVDEFSVDGDPTDVRKRVDEIEQRHGLLVASRLMDPNMGASPSSSKRGKTWQSDFDEAGLLCELADDSEVGRKHINQYMKPDERRLQPRIHVHPRCSLTIAQTKRYVWDEYKRAAEKDQKQTPKPKHDDFPTCLKYVMNSQPTFSMLKGAGRVFHRIGTRRGAYG